MEQLRVIGHYVVEHRNGNGDLIERIECPNLVTDVGAKLLLDTILAGSSYVASTYLGLKGSCSAVVGDTMGSHAGWLEVGSANAPAYTGSRKTVSWASSSGSG